MVSAFARFARRALSGRAALAAATFAAVAALYCALLWPAPRHFATGIPFGAFATLAAPRELQPGDHLQLMYHFDLMRQWLSGEVPPFENRWEFNVGGIPQPRIPTPGYAPFSVPYAALTAAGVPQAAAWNFLQFVSVWLGLVFCSRLARRFGAGRWSALAAAALATCVPYRWTMLGHGSPTGFAMALVPGVALGLDVAVRDRRARGGVLAGLMLAACWASDLHSFLFAGLALPVWGLAALLRSPDAPFAGRRRVFALVRAVLPAAAAALGVAALAMASRGVYEGTNVANGRSLEEIHLHSPEWGALFDPFFDCHAANRFYVGWPLVAAFVLAAFAALSMLDRALVLAARGVSGGEGRLRVRAMPRPFFGGGSGAAEALSGLVLAVGVLLAVFLALGENGPGDGAVLEWLRSAVPPFRMVRQPIKVFCLLPTLLAPLFALGFVSLRRIRGLRPCRGVGALFMPALLALAVVVESRPMHAGVCMLPSAVAAWDAAAADAEARGVEPRVLALPVFKGDEAGSSVYQHSAIRARVPMVNGYAPVEDKDYTVSVAERFAAMAAGALTPDAIRGLREIGVSCVILRENAVTPAVSPFPFAAALRMFFRHPSFRFLASGGGDWAFAFDPAADDSAYDPAPPLPVLEYPVPGRSAWKFRPASPGASARMESKSMPTEMGTGYGWYALSLNDGDAAVSAVVRDAAGTFSESSAELAADPSLPHGSPRGMFVPSPPYADFEGRHRVKIGAASTGEAPVAYLAFTASGGVVESAGGAPEGAFRLDPGRFRHESGLATGLLDGGVVSGLSYRRFRDSPSFVAAAGPELPLALPPGRYRYRLVLREVPDPAIDPPLLVHDVTGVSRLKSRGPSEGSFDYDGASPVSFLLHWSGSADCDAVAIDLVRAD